MTMTSAPTRLHTFKPSSFAFGVAALALIITAFNAIDFDLITIIEGGPRLTRLLGQMWPAFDDRNEIEIDRRVGEHLRGR